MSKAMVDFYIGLFEGLVVAVAIAYGLHKLFPKVPGEVWFLVAAFMFMGWYFLLAIAGSV
jgi:hypothetical protein